MAHQRLGKMNPCVKTNKADQTMVDVEDSNVKIVATLSEFTRGIVAFIFPLTAVPVSVILQVGMFFLRHLDAVG